MKFTRCFHSSAFVGATMRFVNLEPDIDRLFGPIHEDPELFRDLYVPMNTREYSDTFRNYGIWKRPPTTDDEPRPKGPKRDLVNDLITWARQDNSPTVYILSPIGTGKSTYLADLVTRLPETSSGSVSAVVVQAIELDNVDRIVARLHDGVERWLSKNYPDLFSAASDSEIYSRVHPSHCAAFLEEMRSDRIPAAISDVHFAAQDLWLRDRKHRDPISYYAKLYAWAQTTTGERRPPPRLIIAVDNADQHLGAFGDKLLVAVHGVARTLRCLLLMPLRDTSYRANNDQFARASYDTLKHFALLPATSATILSRRLGSIPAVRTNAEYNRFVALLRSRFSDRQGATLFSTVVELIQEWAEPLANYNRRQLLQILKTILASPHITSDSFQRSYSPKDDTFGLARGTKLLTKVKMAMILGRYLYYNDDATEHVFVLNLFDNGDVSESWHSLFRLFLLRFLKKERRGGVLLRELLERSAAALGHTWRPMIASNIGKFVEVGLATFVDESDSYGHSLLNEPVADNIDRYLDRRVHITHNGLFHLGTLIRDGIYLDEMRFTSPVPESLADSIREPFRAGRQSYPDERYEATRVFIRYLVEASRTPQAEALAIEYEVDIAVADILRHYNDLEIAHTRIQLS